MRSTMLYFLLAVALNTWSCGNKQENKDSEEQESAVNLIDESINQQVIKTTVMTKEEQQSLTPDDVIDLFRKGNMRFTKNDLTARDHSSQVRHSVEGQFPKAIVLSCVDSRVPVEDIFDSGIGDIFVARVAGNFVNEDILGSMEYACKVAGSKLILVMGHEHCGAVKAAIDDVKLGNITPMLSKIRPVVEDVQYEGERTSKNEEFIHKVCEGNVEHTIANIRTMSPILKDLEDLGKIKIIGALYDMDNGEVHFIEK